MKWIVDDAVPAIESANFCYDDQEMSISMCPRGENSWCSVVVNDLNIDIDQFGRVLGIWGLCPQRLWNDSHLPLPDAQPAGVFVRRSAAMERYVGYRLTCHDQWPVEYDRCSKWLRVGAGTRSSVAVSIFPGAIFQIDDYDRLEAIWLRLSKI